MRVAIELDEELYTPKELAEFTEPRVVLCRECLRGVGRRDSVYCVLYRAVKRSDGFCDEGVEHGA